MVIPCRTINIIRFSIGRQFNFFHAIKLLDTLFTRKKISNTETIPQIKSPTLQKVRSGLWFDFYITKQFMFSRYLVTLKKNNLCFSRRYFLLDFAKKPRRSAAMPMFFALSSKK